MGYFVEKFSVYMAVRSLVVVDWWLCNVVICSFWRVDWVVCIEWTYRNLTTSVDSVHFWRYTHSQVQQLQSKTSKCQAKCELRSIWRSTRLEPIPCSPTSLITYESRRCWICPAKTSANIKESHHDQSVLHGYLHVL